MICGVALTIVLDILFCTTIGVGFFDSGGQETKTHPFMAEFCLLLLDMY
jgi:hypothetical protein